MTPGRFVEKLESIKFDDNVFNPYSDRCREHDYECAPGRRRRALLRILEAAVARGDTEYLWVGRDLGYRGGRRTGLALTDDVYFFRHAARWGVSIERPTRAEIPERTAAVIWDVLERIEDPVFLWNVFPFHPHRPGDEFTNRAHNSRERRIGEELLFELVLMLKPRVIVPIGNDAACAVRRVSNGLEILQVRHPSYGGQNEFRGQMREIYKLDRKGSPAATARQLGLSARPVRGT